MYYVTRLDGGEQGEKKRGWVGTRGVMGGGGGGGEGDLLHANGPQRP
jgi:hypothetical protein